MLNPPDVRAGRPRPYRSPVREQKTAQTRERIVQAGVAIVERLPDMDWERDDVSGRR